MKEKMRRQITSWVDAPWRMIPAQPILYTYMLMAGIYIIATPSNERIGFEDAGFSDSLYYALNILVIMSPLVTGIAWILIRYRSGTQRVLGFWLRLAGDAGVLAALIAFIITRYIVLRGAMGDSPMFSLIILSGFASVVFVWLVRDIGKIVLLERTANQLKSEWFNESERMSVHERTA